MNILYVITKSESGGAQTHVRQLSSYMKSNGHSVSIMANPGGPLHQFAITEGIPFYPNPHLVSAFRLFKGLRAMRTISAIVSSVRPDIVSLHSSAAGFWGRLAIRGRIPTVFTAHGWGFTTGTPIIRRTIAIVCERIVRRYATRIICVSHQDEHLALRYRIGDSNHLVTIHNGVEVPDVPVDPRSFLSEKKQLVIIGRLAEPKKPESIVRAYTLLSDSVKKHLTISWYGDGPKKSQLLSLINDAGIQNSVVMHGDVSREEIFRALLDPSSAKVFVLVSQYEGLPRSILEAMSCGLPIIASDVGGVREMVDDTNGVVLTSDSEAELSLAIESFVSNPERMQTSGTASRKKVEAEFTLQSMLEKTNTIYGKVLGHNL